MLKTRMIRLLGPALLLASISTLQARPEYARRENMSCIQCHFQADGAGPRNFLGHFYAKNGYSFKNTVYGRGVWEKQEPMAPDLSFQRPTAEGQLLSRNTEILKSIRYRAESKSAYFGGAQLLLSGKPFVRQLDEAKIAYNKNLEDMLMRDFFGMGLYSVETIALHSGLGLGMVHAPLVHLKSRGQKKSPEDYLAARSALFAKVAGFSEREHFMPIYAEFDSGDPHYAAKPDFKTGKNQSWKPEDMDRTISMESMAMGLYSKSILVGQYLDITRPDGEGITPRSGYAAQLLVYEMINTMLWMRYGLAFDGTSFQAFPPHYYETKDLLYIPHQMMVEFEEKTGAPRSYYVKERLSHVRDLGSLLLGLSEFYGLADPNRMRGRKIFGEGSDDSEEFPFSWNARHLARELTMAVLKNMEAMHFDTRLGTLYSTATFVKPLEHIKSEDLGLCMMGLGNVFKYFYDEPEIRHVAGNLLYAVAQFVVQRMQAADGGIASLYDAKRVQVDHLNRTLEVQSLCVLGLMEAYKSTREERFFQAAHKAYEFMITHLWNENLNTFRTHEESPVLRIQPSLFGATVGALREMVLATGDLRTFAYLLAYFDGIMKNYSLQLSELSFTGETLDDNPDSDGDNILEAGKAGGTHGVAPVMASEVQVEPIR